MVQVTVLNGLSLEKKYIENGGDGIYAASKLLYQEPAFRKKKNWIYKKTDYTEL